MKKHEKTTKEISDQINAGRVVELKTPSQQGPLGLLHLREEIVQRLRSSGGRPTDPAWTERRFVPFKPEVWDDLRKLAREMSTSKRKVTPAQVAAMLVERELSKVQAS